jgi:hypothetical protein
MNNETVTIETTVVKQKGRPVVAGSNRQIRLAEREARVNAGGSISKGRPSNPNSARQARLAAQEARKASGAVIKPGRPKVVKTEEAIVETVA